MQDTLFSMPEQYQLAPQETRESRTRSPMPYSLIRPMLIFSRVLFERYGNSLLDITQARRCAIGPTSALPVSMPPMLIDDDADASALSFTHTPGRIRPAERAWAFRWLRRRERQRLFESYYFTRVRPRCRRHHIDISTIGTPQERDESLAERDFARRYDFAITFHHPRPPRRRPDARRVLDLPHCRRYHGGMAPAASGAHFFAQALLCF